MLHITLNDIRLQNPDGYTASCMAKIGQIVVLMNGWTVFTSCVLVKSLFIRDIDIYLERQKGKMNVSSLKARNAPEDAKVWSESETEEDSDSQQLTDSNGVRIRWSTNQRSSSEILETNQSQTFEDEEVQEVDLRNIRKDRKLLGTLYTKGKDLAKNLKCGSNESNIADESKQKVAKTRGKMLGSLLTKGRGVAFLVKQKWIRRRNPTSVTEGAAQEGPFADHMVQFYDVIDPSSIENAWREDDSKYVFTSRDGHTQVLSVEGAEYSTGKSKDKLLLGEIYRKGKGVAAGLAKNLMKPRGDSHASAEDELFDDDVPAGDAANSKPERRLLDGLLRKGRVVSQAVADRVKQKLGKRGHVRHWSFDSASTQDDGADSSSDPDGDFPAADGTHGGEYAARLEDLEAEWCSGSGGAHREGGGGAGEPKDRNLLGGLYLKGKGVAQLAKSLAGRGKAASEEPPGDASGHGGCAHSRDSSLHSDTEARKEPARPGLARTDPGRRSSKAEDRDGGDGAEARGGQEPSPPRQLLGGLLRKGKAVFARRAPAAMEGIEVGLVEFFDGVLHPDVQLGVVGSAQVDQPRAHPVPASRLDGRGFLGVEVGALLIARRALAFEIRRRASVLQRVVGIVRRGGYAASLVERQVDVIDKLLEVDVFLFVAHRWGRRII